MPSQPSHAEPTGAPLVLIAALSENRVIGRGGRLPWHLPDDLAHFKQQTTGKHLVMGRKTFESCPGPLPHRITIVVTRRADYVAAGCPVVHSLEQAIELCRQRRVDEIIIAGGGELYAQALPLADRMILTRIHAHLDGDVFFPPFDPTQWHLIDEQRHPADEKHAHPFTFQQWRRMR